MTFKRPESALVVVHTADRVLLMQRTGQGSEAFWQSITGSLEPGERAADAARRELFEETGIDAQPIDCRLSVRYEIREAARPKYAPGTLWNTEHLFQLALPAPVPVQLAPDEHVGFEWLPVEAAIERVWSWTNREAIRQLCGEAASFDIP